MKQKLFSVLMLLALSACADIGASGRVAEDAEPINEDAGNRMVETEPTDITTSAERFERAGQYKQAYELYMKALAANPTLMRALRGQARTMLYMGQPTEALMQLRDLYRDYPNLSGVRQDYVAGLITMNLLTDAYSVLFATKIAEKLELEEYFQLAVLHELRGQPLEARQLLDEAAQIAPQDFRSQRLLALSFALGEEYRAAVAILYPGLDFPNSQLLARQTLADVYALSGQFGVAMQIADGAYEYAALQDRQALYGLLPKMSRQERTLAFMLGRLSPEQTAALYGNN